MNISKILSGEKDGIKLWDIVRGEVKFIRVEDYSRNIVAIDNHGCIQRYLPDGKIFEEGDCCLFPSKNMKDWEKWTSFSRIHRCVSGEKYYILSPIKGLLGNHLNILSQTENGTEEDNMFWEIGNYFNTHEQAELNRDRVEEVFKNPTIYA